jgi:hypothetical protein
VTVDHAGDAVADAGDPPELLGIGCDVAVDDASRPAYTDILPEERKCQGDRLSSRGCSLGSHATLNRLLRIVRLLQASERKGSRSKPLELGVTQDKPSLGDVHLHCPRERRATAASLRGGNAGT